MRYATRIALAIALLTPAVNVFAETSSRLVANLKAGKPQTIVTYGTSLTDGGAWVGQLHEALNAKFPSLATVLNSGKSGMWSKWGVDNLDSQVITRDFSIGVDILTVIVETREPACVSHRLMKSPSTTPTSTTKPRWPTRETT